jgi:hypothetical protein
MVKRYDKHKSLEWSPELIRTDEESRRIMADCQQLFFMDKNAQITLQTDASDYGIDGYLYQTVDSTVQVITASFTHSRSWKTCSNMFDSI